VKLKRADKFLSYPKSGGSPIADNKYYFLVYRYDPTAGYKR
jgi:hypothetical protein